MNWALKLYVDNREMRTYFLPKNPFVALGREGDTLPREGETVTVELRGKGHDAAILQVDIPYFSRVGNDMGAVYPGQCLLIRTEESLFLAQHREPTNPTKYNSDGITPHTLGDTDVELHEGYEIWAQGDLSHRLRVVRA
jgi:hypothetical protein